MSSDGEKETRTVPVFVPVKKKSRQRKLSHESDSASGSTGSNDNDNNNLHEEPLQLERGENWLRLTKRNLNAVLDETQEDPSHPGGNLWATILDQTSSAQRNSALDEESYLIIDYDEKFPAVAVKDMRQNDDILPPYELCLARRHTENDDEKKKKTAISNDDQNIWEGFLEDELEILPRRQLRILKPGDRLCTTSEDEPPKFEGIGIILELRFLPAKDLLVEKANDDDELSDQSYTQGETSTTKVVLENTPSDSDDDMAMQTQAHLFPLHEDSKSGSSSGKLSPETQPDIEQKSSSEYSKNETKGAPTKETDQTDGPLLTQQTEEDGKNEEDGTASNGLDDNKKEKDPSGPEDDFVAPVNEDDSDDETKVDEDSTKEATAPTSPEKEKAKNETTDVPDSEKKTPVHDNTVEAKSNDQDDDDDSATTCEVDETAKAPAPPKIIEDDEAKDKKSSPNKADSKDDDANKCDNNNDEGSPAAKVDDDDSTACEVEETAKAPAPPKIIEDSNGKDNNSPSSQGDNNNDDGPPLDKVDKEKAVGKGGEKKLTDEGNESDDATSLGFDGEEGDKKDSKSQPKIPSEIVQKDSKKSQGKKPTKGENGSSGTLPDDDEEGEDEDEKCSQDTVVQDPEKNSAAVKDTAENPVATGRRSTRSSLRSSQGKGTSPTEENKNNDDPFPSPSLSSRRKRKTYGSRGRSMRRVSNEEQSDSDEAESTSPNPSASQRSKRNRSSGAEEPATNAAQKTTDESNTDKGIDITLQAAENAEDDETTTSPAKSVAEPSQRTRSVAETMVSMSNEKKKPEDASEKPDPATKKSKKHSEDKVSSPENEDDSKSKRGRRSRAKTPDRVKIKSARLENPESQFSECVPKVDSIFTASPIKADDGDPTAKGRRRRRERGRAKEEPDKDGDDLTSEKVPAEEEEPTEEIVEESNQPEEYENPEEELEPNEDESPADKVTAKQRGGRDQEASAKQDQPSKRRGRKKGAPAKTEENETEEAKEAPAGEEEVEEEETFRKQRGRKGAAAAKKNTEVPAPATATRRGRKSKAAAPVEIPEETPSKGRKGKTETQTDVEAETDTKTPAKSTRKRKPTKTAPTSTKRRKSRAKQDDEVSEEEQLDSTDATDGDDSIKPIVTSTGGVELSSAQKTAIAKLGWTYSDHIGDAQFATHIIAGDKKSKAHMKRTAKLMVAMCNTRNILDLEWLKASLKAKKALPVDDYLVADKEAEKKYDFSMQKSLDKAAEMRAAGTKVLTGWSVYICPKVAGDRAPSQQELRIMVEQAGGILVEKVTKRALEDIDFNRLMIITSDPPKAKQVSKTLEDAVAGGAKQQSTTFLFDCFMRQGIVEG